MTESTAVNSYGIPSDPDEALAAVKNGTLKLTEDASEVTSGPIVEGLTITVKDDAGAVVYDSGGMFQPWGWGKVDNVPAALENEGAVLDSDQIELFNALIASSEKNAKAFKVLVGHYNNVIRSNAKQAEYARIAGIKKPMSEETKNKKVESTISFFASMHGISLDTARQKLTAAGLI